MRHSRRLMILAAAIHLTLGAASARAQTVLVRNAPPDSNIEVVLNNAPVGTAKIGAAGVAVVDVNLQKNVNKTETDAQVFVDVCPTVRRIVVVERAHTPPSPEAGCARRDMGGMFLVRQVSTLVVDFGAASPSLLLRQGSVSLDPPRSWDGGRTGFMLFGGGGLTSLANVTSIACGANFTDCSGEASGLGYTVGAEYWFSPYIAAEGSYIRTADATVSGSGERFRFNNVFEAHIGTAAGKIGIPAGRTRIYGHIGATYTRALFDTDQTVDPLTTTVDGVTETVPGGRVTVHTETRGWSWFFGGGLEVWMAGSFALFGQVDRAALKGSAIDDAEGITDERMTSVFVGAKVRLF
jgi:hypothetical protein